MRVVTALNVFVCAVAMGIGAIPQGVAAQGYPSRSITVVVPFPAGGPSDVVVRILNERMGRSLGQQMIVENVSGAGGTLGSARVAASPSDGYTVLAGSMGSHVAAPVLTPNLKYDPSRDFKSVGFLAHAPAIIAVRKDFPANNIAEFIAYLKQHGDTVKQAHGGVGSSSHMACLLFTSAFGLKPTLIAYRGTGPAINDMIGGHIDFLCEQAVTVAEQIKAGTLRGLVISGSKRLASLPEIPSAKEAGINYDISIWGGMFAPKGVSTEVVNKLAAALDKTLDDPSVSRRISDLGASIPAKNERNPATFDRIVKAEIARWSPILKAAAAQAN